MGLVDYKEVVHYSGVLAIVVTLYVPTICSCSNALHMAIVAIMMVTSFNAVV